MNNIIKLSFLLIFICFGTKNINAQDYHFSQFDLSPLYVSPALTGYMTAQNRIGLKYRSQWASVLQEDQFETMLVSYDGRICPNQGVAFAYGLNLVRDWVGFPTFRTNHYMASFAVHIKLRNGLMFSGGLQGGLLQYELDVNNLNFANQFDGGVGFDNVALPSNELFFNQGQKNLPDISGGILFYSNSFAWNFGVAFHHVYPQNFYAYTTKGVQDDNKTNVRWVIHGTIPITEIGKHFLIFRKMSIIQAPHWQTNIGLDFRLQISGNQTNPMLNSIIIGGGIRASNRFEKFSVVDAITGSFKTDIAQGLILGIGYDFNVSPLKRSTNGAGGVELSLIWEFPIKENSKCVMCPDTNTSSFGQGKWQIR